MSFTLKPHPGYEIISNQAGPDDFLACSLKNKGMVLVRMSGLPDDEHRYLTFDPRFCPADFLLEVRKNAITYAQELQRHSGSGSQSEEIRNLFEQRKKKSQGLLDFLVVTAIAKVYVGGLNTETNTPVALDVNKALRATYYFNRSNGNNHWISSAPVEDIIGVSRWRAEVLMAVRGE